MNLQKIVRSISGKIEGKKILLLLDYDGTLTPIVPKPGLAVLSAPRRRLLKRISGKKLVTMGIVSGRALKNVKKMVGISGIIYCGNHGFEIEGPKIRLIHAAARKFRPALEKIKRKLLLELGGIKGIMVEDKGSTLSVHYRMVRGSDLGRVTKGISAATRGVRAKVTAGKKVWEVRPPVAWDKGSAVRFLIRKIGGRSFVPIYAGDDVTDESAFSVLRRKGITIAVGKKRTSAQYAVKSVREFYKLLNSIIRG